MSENRRNLGGGGSLAESNLNPKIKNLGYYYGFFYLEREVKNGN